MNRVAEGIGSEEDAKLMFEHLSKYRQDLATLLDAWEKAKERIAELEGALNEYRNDVLPRIETLEALSKKTCPATVSSRVEELVETVDKLPQYRDTNLLFVPGFDESWAIFENGKVAKLLPTHHADVNDWLPIDARNHEGFLGWYSTKQSALKAVDKL